MQQPAKLIHILLVEDNPGDVRLTQEAFAEIALPMQLHVAEDGEEAILFLQQQGDYALAPRPDMVLLDLNLPKIDGHQVLRYIKNNDSLRKLPVVVLTTSNAEKDISQTYKLHVNAYLVKPIDYEKFTELVQKIEAFWLRTVILGTST
jgi:two-component system, chemotaxis family, response regulator Rcp1